MFELYSSVAATLGVKRKAPDAKPGAAGLSSGVSSCASDVESGMNNPKAKDAATTSSFIPLTDFEMNVTLVWVYYIRL